ncbi:hypothetical protein BSL78_13496 [Apostichopus japonicus]|uniref:Reverse transcriptase RNase H-like domain-containing protein n=1 Tax=Stichopus japonicus TaxID=307972 RepID=A0A2G8KNU7_STIJA|nr:hypothetical protein BSL78_13496 [Apostichopus japonicus]
MFGLLINITAFKHLLGHCEFDAVVDHSALVQLMRSKHAPPSARLRILLFRLSDYAVIVRYEKGSDIPLADFLSRAPQNDDSEIDQVVPLAFSSISELPPEQSELILNSDEDNIHPIMTRSKARSMGITVPELFAPQNNRKTRSTTSAYSAPRPATTNPVNSTHRGSRKLSPHLPTPSQARQSSASSSDPFQSLTTHITFPPRPIVRLIPTPSISEPEPRLVDRSETDTTCDPPPDLYVPPTPIITKIYNLVTKHIPKQHELDKIMKKIQKKIIHDYNLPLEANKLRLLQETDPHFKPIYDFLAHNILPS